MGKIIANSLFGWSAGEFENQLRTTKWYKQTNDWQRNWQTVTSPKEKKETIASTRQQVINALEQHYGEKVFVTRKGAINADQDAMGIIPGSMGAKSFIVKGRGVAESFNSCSHGAGRKMSRGAAKRAFTQDDLARQTSGVECRKDAGVLDEIPGAYKSIEAVMKNQEDLVEVLAEIKQVVCVKG